MHDTRLKQLGVTLLAVGLMAGASQAPAAPPPAPKAPPEAAAQAAVPATQATGVLARLFALLAFLKQ